jgi:hypothetical protein
LLVLASLFTYLIPSKETKTMERRREEETKAYGVLASIIASNITGCNSGITMAQVHCALSNSVTLLGSLLRSLPPAGGRVKALHILNYLPFRQNSGSGTVFTQYQEEQGRSERRREEEAKAYGVLASIIASNITGCNSSITLAQVLRTLSNSVTLLSGSSGSKADDGDSSKD